MTVVYTYFVGSDVHVELFSSRKVIVYIYLHSEEVELSRGLEKLITCARSDFFFKLVEHNIERTVFNTRLWTQCCFVLTKGVLFCWRIVLDFSRRC